jgi:tyrosyl-tRNA synthetase
LKVALAKLIIKDFHSQADADAAEDEFNRRFVQKEIPDEIEEKTIATGPHNLAQLLADTGLTTSKGEARRLIEQGGVKVNGEKATAANTDIDVTSGGVLLQVGKRKFLKVKS